MSNLLLVDIKKAEPQFGFSFWIGINILTDPILGHALAIYKDKYLSLKFDDY